ncbi:MAG TPA: hypothetical protein VFU82_05505 [Gammaproteobacteria bacterium]|jgi:hypothetical protein|nr:hypothetical protein [Gammaproteobacteria bacterium]
MNKNTASAENNLTIDNLELDIQRITSALVELAKDDKPWWLKNLLSLASQPLDSLKFHLMRVHDTSLSHWKFNSKDDTPYSILDPIEALTWLAGICRLDRVLLGALPREFVDQYELQWKVLALYWCSA